MRPCRCGREHRSHRALANCLWPRAAWIAGTGRYALLAHCDVLTIQLHRTMRAALDSKAAIDLTACGGACQRSHEIVDLGATS